jgi:hypothetical protein
MIQRPWLQRMSEARSEATSDTRRLRLSIVRIRAWSRAPSAFRLSGPASSLFTSSGVKARPAICSGSAGGMTSFASAGFLSTSPSASR